MKVFQFAKILEIAKLPEPLKEAVISGAYENSSVDGMQLEAAVKLMDIPSAVRNATYAVRVSTFETLCVEAVGKFVVVRDF